MSNTSPTIAGLHGGKRVICAPSAIKEFEALKSLALQHHHWARIALSQLQGLSSGRIGKDNIFIKPNENRRPGAHGIDEFFVILPGCTATIERKQNDDYHIIGLNVDTRFGELQEQTKKPGMFLAKKQDGKWECQFKGNGNISNPSATYSVVSVCNSGYPSPENAAAYSAPEMKKYLGGGAGPMFESKGFHLHFTPGTKKLGGLRNFKDAIAPLNNQNTLESAQLLAKAMYDARKTSDVRWVSEYGGSAVLTQAMEMLAQQGVKLNKHVAFMVKPTTDANTAMEAALKLGIHLDRQLSLGGDYTATRTQWKAINTRRSMDSKNYSLGQASWDRFCHLKTLHGVTSAAIGGAALTAGAIGISTVTPAALIPSTVAPIVASIAKVIGGTAAIAKTADKASALIAPKTYDKITGKFK